MSTRHRIELSLLLRVGIGLIAVTTAASGAAAARRADEVSFAGQVRIVEGHPDPKSQPGAVLPAAQPGQQSEAVLIEGHSSAGIKAERLELTLFNRTSRWLSLSYSVDTYVARLSDGRSLTLDKDFLTYPARVSAGSQASIKLLLPSGVWARDVAHILATIDEGRVPIVIQAIPPLVPTFPGTDRPVPVAPADPVLTPGSRERDLAWEMTPVLVEFEQELGGNLKIEVRWDADGEQAKLGAGDYQTFHLMPGLHYLYFWVRMAALSDTKGSIPVLVKPAQVMRVAFDGSPHLAAAQVRARVWQQDELVLDQNFGPRTPQP